MTSADRLLDEITPLDPGDRVRRAVAVARAADPAARAALLTDLGGRDPYARGLAVTMAVATGDVAHLDAAARDPYPQVRARALAASALPEAAVRAVLAEGALVDRRRAYTWLRTGGHRELADALLPGVRDRWGDGEAARLLPACSPSVVERLLPEVGYAVRSWHAMTRRHPGPVAAYADAELAALPVEARAAWWTASAGLVRALAEHDPAGLLGLCERRLIGPLPTALLPYLARLLGVDAARVVRLVLAEPERVTQLARRHVGRAARTRLTALPNAEIGALLRASGPAQRLLVELLRGLPPARRAAVFDLAHAHRDLTAALLPDEVLALLPHDRRHAEARRMLAVPAVADRPTATLRVTRFLPFPQARPVLEAATRSADADERALGHELLVRCAAATGDPGAVTAVLDGLDRIPNERDPVRARLLAAVARVRPALFEDAVVPALERIVTGAVDARDTSATARDALHRLVLGIVAHPWPARSVLLEWALATVERLGAWQAAALVGPALRQLPREQEHAVFARMRAPLTAAVRTGRAGPVLALVRALGSRAWKMPELQELVRLAVRTGTHDVVRSAAEVWLAPRRGRSARVADLLQLDESLVVLPPVLAAVVRRHTGPLDALVLSGRRLQGRFGTSGRRWIPLLPPATALGWSSVHSRGYASLLRSAIADPALDRATRARLVATLAALPGDPAAVRGLLDDPDVLLAEAALTGLGRGDRPEDAFQALLARCGTDRARVALSAAARCARAIPPARLATLLADAPTAKVTARKELARWQAAFRPEGALETLLDIWQRAEEQRDVRIAALAALRAWYDDDRVWAALEEAGCEDRFFAGAVLEPAPRELPPAHRRRYAGLVRRLTGHPDPDVARGALRALAAWLPWAPGAAADLSRAITDLTGTATWRAAADATLIPAVWTSAPDLLPTIVRGLMSVPDGPDADPLRDRPGRQRLAHLVDELCRNAAVARRHPGPVRAVAERLAADPTELAAAARLRALLLWPGPGFAEDLAALGSLVGDRSVAALAAAGELDVRDWDPAGVGAGVDALEEIAGAGAGLLAVALVATAGARAGWPQEWRSRLRELRRHPDPDVRAAALRAVAAPE
ncbi:hypothetical protein [Pseudonocardia nigra]|uniref:hypothetical protein n=1 Tax=Pseudonocardia nigra TaxID=1921578 RepID=UPI001C5E4A03|nr:hypothetical protein [Pseudonocardia nigra]